MSIPTPDGGKITLGGFMTFVALLFVLVLVSMPVFRICCVTFVDNYELAYKYDALTGKITRIDRTGYVLQRPFVDMIHTVDLRPMQVCNNANARVLNCKLVQFNPDGLGTLLAWHGRDWEKSVTTSSTTTVGSTSALAELLKSYAYDGSGRACPFLKVIREIKPDEAQSLATAPQ